MNSSASHAHIFHQIYFHLPILVLCSPVTKQDGTELSHKEVITLLDRDTVAYDAGLGFNNNFFNELFRVSIKVEKKNYALGVSWCAIRYSRASSPRIGKSIGLLPPCLTYNASLEVAVGRFKQVLPELKRDGSDVVSSVAGSLLYNASSSSQVGHTGYLRSPKFNTVYRRDPSSI